MGSTVTDIPMYLWRDIIGYCDLPLSCILKRSSKILDGMAGTDVLLYKVTTEDVGAIYDMPDKFWRYVVDDEQLLSALWRIRPAAHYFILRKIVQNWQTENVDILLDTYPIARDKKEFIPLALRASITNNDVPLAKKIVQLFPQISVPTELITSPEMWSMIIYEHRNKFYGGYTMDDFTACTISKASECGNYDIIKLLLTKPSQSLISKLNTGRSAFALLIKAINGGYVDIVEILIQALPNIDKNIYEFRGSAGESVLDLAVNKKNIKLTKILKKRYPELDISSASYTTLIVMFSRKNSPTEISDMNYLMMLFEYFPDLKSKLLNSEEFREWTRGHHIRTADEPRPKIAQIIHNHDKYMTCDNDDNLSTID